MTKVTQTRDVQSLAFGIGGTVSGQAPGETGTATASSGTTLTTNSGRTAVTNDLAGQIVFANTNATWASGTIIYGVIQSNTSGTNSVLTVDGWTTLAGASGSTPASTSNYIIAPCVAPFWYIALSDDVAAVAGSETGAAIAVTGGKIEITTNGLGRALADTLTHTAGTTNAAVAKTFTYTGSGAQTVGRMAVVNSRVASKNFAYFVTAFAAAATPASNGDTVAVTDTITVG